MSETIQVPRRRLPPWAVALAIILTLVAAWAFGLKRSNEEITPYLQQVMPAASVFTRVAASPATFIAADAAGRTLGYVTVTEAVGYGGPLQVVTAVDSGGAILRTVIAANKETPSFLSIVLRQDYLEQFKGKPATSPFHLGSDINAVSGATISSRAIAEAVRKGVHGVARSQLGLNVAVPETPWHVGAPELVVPVLFLWAVLGSLLRRPQWRVISLAGGVILLGAWLNRQVSMAQFSAIPLGYFPPVRSSLLWYVTLFGAAGSALLLGRNLYCYWVCPFGGAQELAAQVGGGRFRCAHHIDRRLRLTRYVLLWGGLLLVLATRNPGLASVEPFGTLFGLQGTTAAWLLLLLVLGASALSKRFWCNYFCPVGAILEMATRARQWLKGLGWRGSRWHQRAIRQHSS